MAEALSITCWLTPQELPAVIPATRSQGGETVYIMPVGVSVSPLPLLLDAYVIGDGYHPIGCKYNQPLTTGHVWSPDPDMPGSVAPFVATYSLIRVGLPRTPFWSGASITMELIGTVTSIGPYPPAGPAGEGQDDSLLIPSDGWELTLQPVPGETLLVTHHTHGFGDYSVSAFHTCKGLTGGWIRAKRSHATIADAFVYDVDVEGELFTNLIATDFEPRSVNDWCFLLRSATDASDLEFTATTPESPEIAEVLMLAPLSIMGEG